MFKKILSAIGMGSAGKAAPTTHSTSGPYKDEAANHIYQLLFCDRPLLFKASHEGPPRAPWDTLLSDRPDFEAIDRIARDPAQESRVRMLGFNALRVAGQEGPAKELLGTIIEVGLPAGLDTLAVFTDGGARYINHTGRMTVIEGTPNPFDHEIKEVIAASRPIVGAIGPWNKDRLPAPRNGKIRMTFLVSDGLYFGEGPMNVMQKEAMAAPLIGAAGALLVKIVEAVAGK